MDVMPTPGTPAMPAWGISQLGVPHTQAHGLLTVLALLCPYACGVSSLRNSWFGEGVGQTVVVLL